jgi:hypothetical protein
MLPQGVAGRIAERIGNAAEKQLQVCRVNWAKIPTLRNVQVFPL